MLALLLTGFLLKANEDFIVLNIFSNVYKFPMCFVLYFCVCAVISCLELYKNQGKLGARVTY